MPWLKGISHFKGCCLFSSSDKIISFRLWWRPGGHKSLVKLERIERLQRGTCYFFSIIILLAFKEVNMNTEWLAKRERKRLGMQYRYALPSGLPAVHLEWCSHCCLCQRIGMLCTCSLPFRSGSSSQWLPEIPHSQCCNRERAISKGVGLLSCALWKEEDIRGYSSFSQVPQFKYHWPSHAMSIVFHLSHMLNSLKNSQYLQEDWGLFMIDSS